MSWCTPLGLAPVWELSTASNPCGGFLPAALTCTILMLKEESLEINSLELRVPVIPYGHTCWARCGHLQGGDGGEWPKELGQFGCVMCVSGGSRGDVCGCCFETHLSLRGSISQVTTV